MLAPDGEPIVPMLTGSSALVMIMSPGVTFYGNPSTHQPLHVQPGLLFNPPRKSDSLSLVFVLSALLPPSLSTMPAVVAASLTTDVSILVDENPPNL